MDDLSCIELFSGCLKKKKKNQKRGLFIYLFIKTYLYRVVHNQTILILFYSVAMFLAKSKSSDD